MGEPTVTDHGCVDGWTIVLEIDGTMRFKPCPLCEAKAQGGVWEALRGILPSGLLRRRKEFLQAVEGLSLSKAYRGRALTFREALQKGMEEPLMVVAGLTEREERGLILSLAELAFRTQNPIRVYLAPTSDKEADEIHPELTRKGRAAEGWVVLYGFGREAQGSEGKVRAPFPLLDLLRRRMDLGVPTWVLTPLSPTLLRSYMGGFYTFLPPASLWTPQRSAKGEGAHLASGRDA